MGTDQAILRNTPLEPIQPTQTLTVMDSSMETKPLPEQTLPMQTLTVTDSSMERKQLPGPGLRE